MSIEPERLDRLQLKTGCSLEKVKEAMGQGDGSLLEGLLYLEGQGHVEIPENNGFFSTQHSGEEQSLDFKNSFPEEHKGLRFTLQLVKEELLENYVELWYKNTYLGHIPVVCFLLLMPLTYGTLFPMIVLPMFVGVHYRFSNETSFLAEFNSVIARLSRNLYEMSSKFKRKLTGNKKKRGTSQ